MKIFISITSYRDDLLFFTINDCITKAANPENLVFAIVDQNDVDQREKIDTLGLVNQIRYLYINNVDTLGCSWARSLAFTLWANEEYLLQVDSHTLFEKNWDSILLKQYKKLKEISEKPIISTYPYNFSFDENNRPEYQPQSKEYALVLRPDPDTELTETNAVLRFIANHQKSDKPVIGCHIAGGFIFTSSDFIHEVPYDPYLYFHGDEQSISIRAYTRGWDIYHPNHIPLYHMYKKLNNNLISNHWHKTADEQRCLSSSYLGIRAAKRLADLFYNNGMKGTDYGLGDNRSLDEFIEFSGIDFKNKTIKIIDFN